MVLVSGLNYFLISFIFVCIPLRINSFIYVCCMFWFTIYTKCHSAVMYILLFFLLRNNRSLRYFCMILYWLCRSGLPSGTVGGNKTDASSQQSSGNGTRSTVKADNDSNPNERREQRSSGLEKDRNIPKGNKYTYIPSLSTAVPFLISIISLLEVKPSGCFIWSWNLVGWLSMKHVYILLDFTKLLISLLGAIKIYCPNQATLPPVCQTNNWTNTSHTSLLPMSPWPATSLYLLPACPFSPLFPTSWHFPLRLKERIHDGDGDGARK